MMLTDIVTSTFIQREYFIKWCKIQNQRISRFTEYNSFVQGIWNDTRWNTIGMMLDKTIIFYFKLFLYCYWIIICTLTFEEYVFFWGFWIKINVGFMYDLDMLITFYIHFTLYKWWQAWRATWPMSHGERNVAQHATTPFIISHQKSLISNRFLKILIITFLLVQQIVVLNKSNLFLFLLIMVNNFWIHL